MFSYILVVPRGYILLISICPILKAAKLHIIASCAKLAILFKNYFLLNSTKNSTDCFVLEVSTVDNVSRF